MAIIELDIEVSEVSKIVILYDRLQLFRSPDETGSPSPFVPITDMEATSAILDGTVSGPWNLNGTTLNVTLDGADNIAVSFTGVDPASKNSVIDILNAAVAGHASSFASEVPTDTNKIRLKSPLTGTRSIVQVSGSAATVLGLSTVRANGKGASPLLSANTEHYLVQDFDGLDTYWYRARYISSVTGAVSPFSNSFLGGEGVALPELATCIGKIAISDASGRPVKDRRIIFVPTSSQVISDGSGNNYGILPSVDRIISVTDNNGRASIPLVKGQRLKVFIEGTTFQREFVVPDADFDILTVASAQPDPLSIVTAPPLPIRVS